MCLTPLVLGLSTLDTPCASASLELAGRYAMVVQDAGSDPIFSLHRARVEASLGRDGAWTRVALMPARSGDGSGDYGVAGESLVYSLQIAEVGYTRGPLGLTAGLVDDPWGLTGNVAWGHISWSGIMSSRNGWTHRSDLGVVGAFETGPVTASVTVSNGEGAKRPEQNDAKNVAGLVTVAVMDLPLSVTLYGSQGSLGADNAGNHRVGVRVHGQAPRLGYGVEGLAAWGVGGDESATPRGVSGWVSAGRDLPVTAVVRADAWQDLPGDADTNGLRAIAWAGPELGPATVALGVEHTRTGGGSTDSTMFGVQLSSRLATVR
jgi:hypothetical protein